MQFQTLIVFFFLSILLGGCPAEQKQKNAIPPSGLAGVGQAQNPKKTNLPKGHPPLSGAQNDMNKPHSKTALNHSNQPARPKAEEQKIQGTILEVHSATNYTYLKFKDQKSKEQWAAVLTLQISKGDKVEIHQQMVMENFQSKSLNRSFDKIIFGTAKKLP